MRNNLSIYIDSESLRSLFARIASFFLPSLRGIFSHSELMEIVSAVLQSYVAAIRAILDLHCSWILKSSFKSLWFCFVSITNLKQYKKKSSKRKEEKKYEIYTPHYSTACCFVYSLTRCLCCLLFFFFFFAPKKPEKLKWHSLSRVWVAERYKKRM